MPPTPTPPTPGGGFGGSSRGGSSGTNIGHLGSGSIWDNFEFQGKGNIWSYDPDAKPGTDKAKFDPSIGVVYGTKDLALLGDPDKDGFTALGGKVGIGAGISKEDGLIVGVHGEYYTAQGKADGVYGDSNLGATGGVAVKLLSADGFAGYKDGSIGAEIGASLVSVEGEVGANVMGVNVGVKGEVGLKLELGAKIGKETLLKLPFVTIGFTIGGAKE